MSLRRSMLFCPANNRHMLKKIAKYEADSLIIDLEDSISQNEKIQARESLNYAMSNFNFGNSEIFVRINSPHSGLFKDDLEAVFKSGVNKIRIPMCQTAEDLISISEIINEFEDRYDLPRGWLRIQAAIESPLGVLNAKEIAFATDRLISISFGTGDYSNLLNIDRGDNFDQFLFARSQVVLAANAVGLDAIDTVYFDIKNDQGFIREAEHIKMLGFKGKSCVHPRQVALANEIFMPNQKEIEEARRIVEAAKLAEEKGLGVFEVQGKMVDKPIVERALKIIGLID